MNNQFIHFSFPRNENLVSWDVLRALLTDRIQKIFTLQYEQAYELAAFLAIRKIFSGEITPIFSITQLFNPPSLVSQEYRKFLDLRNDLLSTQFDFIMGEINSESISHTFRINKKSGVRKIGYIKQINNLWECQIKEYIPLRLSNYVNNSWEEKSETVEVALGRFSDDCVSFNVLYRGRIAFITAYTTCSGYTSLPIDQAWGQIFKALFSISDDTRNFFVTRKLQSICDDCSGKKEELNMTPDFSLKSLHKSLSSNALGVGVIEGFFYAFLQGHGVNVLNLDYFPIRAYRPSFLRMHKKQIQKVIGLCFQWLNGQCVFFKEQVSNLEKGIDRQFLLDAMCKRIQTSIATKELPVGNEKHEGEKKEYPPVFPKGLEKSFLEKTGNSDALSTGEGFVNISLEIQKKELAKLWLDVPDHLFQQVADKNNDNWKAKGEQILITRKIIFDLAQEIYNGGEKPLKFFDVIWEGKLEELLRLAKESALKSGEKPPTKTKIAARLNQKITRIFESIVEAYDGKLAIPKSQASKIQEDYERLFLNKGKTFRNT